jgi:hypothetical protein
VKQLREDNEIINKKLEVIEKQIIREQKMNTVINDSVNITITFRKEDISKIDEIDIMI